MKVNNPVITNQQVVDLFNRVYILSNGNFDLFYSIFQKFGMDNNFIGGIQDYIIEQKNISTLNQINNILNKYNK